MTVEQRKPLRASDGDRDRVLVRLHTAYAEGRLTETELDERIDRTLAARTEDDLAEVSADLPAADAPSAEPVPSGAGRGPAGRFQMAYKSTVRRTGLWRLPERFTSVVYKGHALLDLRAAELDGPVTTIRVLAYKSTVDVIIPPGVRVETGGMGVSADLDGAPGPGAPVVHIQGLAYKGRIEAKDRIRRV